MNLKQYLEASGTTQEAFAKDIGVSQGMVAQWVAGKKEITAERANEIERATGGQVTRIELRPDVFGPVLHNEEIQQFDNAA